MKIHELMNRLWPGTDPEKPVPVTDKEKVIAAGGWWPNLPPQRDAASLKKMGIDPKTGASAMPQILGPERTVRVKAVNVANQARVLWFDPELARMLGFKVPASNILTAELRDEILRALAYRLLHENEAPAGRPVIEMFVDMYGGTGTGGNEGAGRAAFFPYLNAYDKGLHNTPLSKIDTSDPVHTHGLELLREAGLEAIWGQVGSNLFSAGATRALAIIDIGDFVDWGPNNRERACLLIRVGSHARPAHALSGYQQSGPHSKSVFVQSAEALGLLQGTLERPDYKETALKMLDHHARAAAEQYRWRILHGAMSTSNMIFDAQMIDASTNMAQPRTAPIKALEHTYAFGEEHTARAEELARMYNAVGGPGINFEQEMRTRYRRQRELQFLKSFGFKESLATELQKGQPSLVRELDEILSKLAALKNSNNDLLMLYKTATGISAVDVFHLLTAISAELWADPAKVTVERIVELLAVDVHGGSKKDRQKLREAIRENAERLQRIFPKIIAAAEAHADTFYDGVDDMKRAVAKRASFENRPLDQMSHERMNNALQSVISGYHPDNPDSIRAFSQTIDGIVHESMRNVDALLAQGGKRRLSDGTVEVQKRTIAGVDYAVRIAPDGTRKLHVALPARDLGGDRLEVLNAAIHKNDLDKLVYHHTTNGWRELGRDWRKPNRAQAELEQDEELGLRVAFEIEVDKGDVAHLEGLFHYTHEGSWLRDGTSNFKGYSFAVPDDKEL